MVFVQLEHLSSLTDFYTMISQYVTDSVQKNQTKEHRNNLTSHVNLPHNISSYFASQV